MSDDNRNAVAPASHRPTSEAGGKGRGTHSEGAPTTEQLREAIDSGETGDKIGFPDPASVPLGADAEAGGYPTTAKERRAAYEQETKRPDAPDRTDTAGDERHVSSGRPGDAAKNG